MHPASLISYFFLYLGCLSLISAHPVRHGTVQFSHDRHNHHHHHQHHRNGPSRLSRTQLRLQPEPPLLELRLKNLTPDHQKSIAVEESSPRGVLEALDSNDRMAR